MYDYDQNDDDETTEELEQQSYWGYLRDKNADRKLTNPSTNINTKKKKKETASKQIEINDAYWGIFKDTHLNSTECELETNRCFSESSSPSHTTYSLSSSINSLSRFKDTDLDHEQSDIKSASYCEAARLDFDYKTSKFKIQARKRDEQKILIQSLEDKEALFKKETIKSFDSNYLLNLENKKSTSTSSLSSFKYSTKIKDINFLHFTTFQLNATSNQRFNLSKFKNIFNTLSKLKKTINVFNGDFVNDIATKTDIPLLNSVHASLYDLNGLIRNYNKSNDLSKKTTAVSLCSNVYEFNMSQESSSEKVFGNENHSTMLFEFQNVKIGFMALLDKQMFDKLNKLIKTESIYQKETVIFTNDYDDDDDNEKENGALDSATLVEYNDYLEEANRLSKQLRMCGANIIVCLVNMDSEQNEMRLLREASDIDIIFSANNQLHQTNKIDLKKNCFNNRYLIRTESNYECVSLVSLRLDEFNSNQIVDVSIHKYIVD